MTRSGVDAVEGLSDLDAPLRGVRILSFTQFLLGPAGVQYLADLGADVIKIEPPGKGAWERGWAGQQAFVNGVSVFFLAFNRNQRSLTLDLKQPKASEVLEPLLASADVLVQNYRPGVMERFGLGYEDLRERYPRLIYVSASGYGEQGPYRDRPGQDLLLQAMAGICAVTGRSEDPPTPAGAAIVDQHGAALLAMATEAALIGRERTGRGRKIEISMLRAALDLQQEPMAYHLNGFPFRRSPSGLGSGFHPAPYGIYRTSDGHIALSLSPVSALREALGLEALAPFEDGDAAFARRDEARNILEDAFRNESTEWWIQRLLEHKIWCAPVQDYETVLADPHVRSERVVVELEDSRAGGLRLLGFPVKVEGVETSRRPPPGLGEHTEEILKEIGLPDDRIADLRRERVV